MILKFLSRDNAKGIAFKAAAEPETATEATLEAAKALGFAPVHHKVLEDGPYAGAWVWSPNLILGVVGSCMTNLQMTEISIERDRIQSAGGRVLKVVDPRGDRLAEQRLFVALGGETATYNAFAKFAAEPDSILGLAEAMSDVTLTREQYALAKRVGVAACERSAEPTILSLVEVWRGFPPLAAFADALGVAALPGYQSDGSGRHVSG